MVYNPNKLKGCVTVLSSDDILVEDWIWAPGAPAILRSNLTGSQLLALRDQDYATKAVTAAQVSVGALVKLYREQKWDVAVKLRRIGERIISTDTYDYARGIGRNKLIAIYHNRALLNDRGALIKRLFASS